MRLKYPHIAVGALASSAPVLQFEDIVPPETYYDIVSNDFKRESVSCFSTIKDYWDVIESEGQKNNGLSHLMETFGFCKRVKRLIIFRRGRVSSNEFMKELASITIIRDC